MLKILSLGAGVQSTTLLLMSCKGELPKLDCAIFADTGWEPKAVYEHFEWLKPYAESHGIPVHVISHGNIKEDALVSRGRGTIEEGTRWASMPLRTVAEDGTQGMIRRQCTAEYKIAPIEKFIRRELMGLKPRQRAPKKVIIEQWMGISTDEKQRARMSQKPWIDFRYPLITDLSMSRWHCIQWLKEKFPEREVPRSACIGCPYRSNEEWRHLKETAPDDWEDACQFDEQIRNCGGMRGKVYLHRDCVPLRKADIRNAEDCGQLGFSEECMGMCNT